MVATEPHLSSPTIMATVSMGVITALSIIALTVFNTNSETSHQYAAVMDEEAVPLLSPFLAIILTTVVVVVLLGLLIIGIVFVNRTHISE